jgi:hypothetical protein
VSSIPAVVVANEWRLVSGWSWCHAGTGNRFESCDPIAAVLPANFDWAICSEFVYFFRLWGSMNFEAGVWRSGGATNCLHGTVAARLPCDNLASFWPDKRVTQNLPMYLGIMQHIRVRDKEIEETSRKWRLRRKSIIVEPKLRRMVRSMRRASAPIVVGTGARGIGPLDIGSCTAAVRSFRS